MVMDKTLSILIPARNEMFLGKTVENLVENIEGQTNIIVVCDGYNVPIPEIPKDPRVTVLINKTSIGQRAATNQAARLSTAKYIAKTDAHCAFAKGFDRILMDDMEDDITMVPTMKNLHAFDWVCEKGHRRYQGPSGVCTECGGETKMDIVWRAKPSPNSTSYRFDRTLHFQYFGEYKKKQAGDIVETMSLQGSFFMLTREKYWELNICDEGFGSWGQQGGEVALKTWLSGGRVLVNKKTWYAHMFRTQGGDFGFPYPLSSKDVQTARDYSRNLFLNEAWPLAKRNLQWLFNKFSPIPDWHTVKKGIIYYSDGTHNEKILRAGQEQLLKAGIPIVSATLVPMAFGKNIVISGERGPLTMFKQILAALEASDAEIVYFCEDDVLYHPTHFDFIPLWNDVMYYNTNVWKVDIQTKKATRTDDCRQLSGLCAYRDALVKHYKKRVELVEKNGYSAKMGFEPGTHNREERVDDLTSKRWESSEPNVDIRHDKNMTPTKRGPEDFRNQKYAEGWTEGDCPMWAKDII
jgi:glycosyltransferase involved in cell wall biosynthesis